MLGTVLGARVPGANKIDTGYTQGERMDWK